MDIEKNKATVRRCYEEVFGKGRLELVDDLMTPDYVNVDPATPGGGRLEGRDAFRGLVRTFRAASPDMKMTIDRQIAEGDSVVSHWVLEGSHAGDFYGLAPTQRRFRFEGITMTRFRGDRIAEDHAVWDLHGLLVQIGAAR